MRFINKETGQLSFDPMKFGSESDLKTALTELRWRKSIKGKLMKIDWKTVSGKYKFPISFLKKGLSGFSYPEDWVISRSKWFPIIYNWVARDKQYSLNLFKLQFDHLRARFYSILFCISLIAVFFNIDLFLQAFFEFSFIQRVSVVIIPFILSFIALYFELKNNISNKKAKLDEYSMYLDEMGLGYIRRINERFIEEHYREIIFAGNVILKKMRIAPTLQLFPIGVKEIEKEPSRSDRLLRKLGLVPESSVSIEKEEVPIFYGENTHQEYVKRIKELVKESEGA